jgi:hypothetical protein
MRYALIATSLVLFVLSGALVSCDEDTPLEEPGGLSIEWRVAPLGCKDSGVQIVTAEVQGPSSPAQVVYPCDSGRTVIEDLAPGRYNIRLYGVDQTGRATFASAQFDVGVSPGTITPVEAVRLTAKEARLEVNWFFENGRLCAQNGVSEVSVGVYDKDAYAIDERIYSCGTARGVIEGLQSGSYLIHVLGLAADGTGLFQGIKALDLQRGDDAVVEVELESCEEGC